jgi:glycogen debranching enzyme
MQSARGARVNRRTRPQVRILRRQMDELDALLSDEGWPYASTPPVEEGDPGRFHCLFGRDSLITALQLLPERPDVARATLRALARRQGRAVHLGTQEEPGKIGHEFRDAPAQEFVDAGWPSDGPFAYYGTADATSWFIVLATAAGSADAALRAAGSWLAGALDRGDGLVRHGPGEWGALTQQGWRDTIDPRQAYGGGILRPDGSVPEPPLADIDTQAVAYAALRALGWHDRADALRARLSRLVPDVLAVEAGERVVPGAGSQLGWLLWADALDGDAREVAAERLCRPDILTAYGLRTLSSESPVFVPHAYHRGTVWPFDSWLGWGGLRAAGRTEEAERVRTGVLAALDRLGRSPELYAVNGDGEVEPVALSNRVQAWTVGARWALENEWDGRPPHPSHHPA